MEPTAICWVLSLALCGLGTFLLGTIFSCVKSSYMRIVRGVTLAICPLAGLAIVIVLGKTLNEPLMASITVLVLIIIMIQGASIVAISNLVEIIIELNKKNRSEGK